LAYALCSVWNDVACEVALWGPIVHVEAVWLDKRAAKKVSATKIFAALRSRALTNHSIVVFKAFPYPHDHWAIEDPEDPAFERRTTALTRHYLKEFGAEPLPTSPDDNWMWLPNPNGEVFHMTRV
jgi:hypothetical protein